MEMIIEVGLTGEDWEPTEATKFFAQINEKEYEFGPTKEAALEALLAELEHDYNNGETHWLTWSEQQRAIAKALEELL
jgi:hypothetical protein